MPLTIDIHVHICPPQVRRDRSAYLQEEPEFAAIYQNPEARLVGASELIASMDEQGVTRSVVFGFPWRKAENFHLNNDYVLEAASRFPRRLIPFCCLEAGHPRASEELERCLALGAKGLGELAFYAQGLDQNVLRAMVPLAGLCASAGVPVLLHTNEPIGHLYPGKSPMNLAQIYELIRSFPETKWILAHGGGGLPFFGFLKKEVPEVLANCWFDTAAFPFLYRPEVLPAMARAVGPEKMLFGSDYPLLPPSRYRRDFERSGLSETELAGLFGQNAAALLSLEGSSICR